MLIKASAKLGLGLLFVSGCGVFFIAGIVSCDTAPAPFPIFGPDQGNNELPTLEIIEPVEDIVVGQGDPFLIRWEDTDRDSNARISFQLVNIETNAPITLISNISEDSSTDRHTAISSVPIANYYLKGTITDGDGSSARLVEVFATLSDGISSQRVIITIADPGVIPPTVPPTVAVTEPTIDLGVAPGDVLRIVVQPTALLPDPTRPFDPDSNIRLFVLLDFDRDRNNDNPDNGKCSGGVRNGLQCTLDNDCGTGICKHDGIIVLADTKEATIIQGVSAIDPFEILIDLTKTPVRASGEPYHVRATVDDLRNPRVHSYAPGTVSVVELAVGDADGKVDLFNIGRTQSGVRFQGFNPGARLGSKVEGVSDFDGVATDGAPIDDFIMVAQFGNPQNLGLIGEAYLVYGLNDLRFGGTISVNSIANTISGAIFQAPPVRDAAIPGESAFTSGITDVGSIPDLTGDGKPELLFGLPHVHGAYDSMDYDPADTDTDGGGGLGCYPDGLVNNLSDVDSDDFPGDIDTWYAGGMAVVFNSTNRDLQGILNPVRLDSAIIPLEFVGQLGLTQDGLLIALDGFGFRPDDTVSANIVVGSTNAIADVTGNDPSEPNREAGVRFIAGGFDVIDAFGLGQPARAGLFGQNVASIADLDSDALPEFIFSAPNNEAYFSSLAVDFPLFSSHALSTIWRHNVIIIPGDNYNRADWRGRGDGRTSSFPSIDGGADADCDDTETGVGRLMDFPPDAFQVIQENINDRLGDGQSAGDFDNDGLDDILCGAPLNDKTATKIDTGATYIIFTRSVFGDVDLRNADDDSLRSPMLRIQGVKADDQIGWAQAGGLDVNGDGNPDVVFGSPRTDYGGVTGECRDDVNANGIIGDATDYVLATFEDCVADFGDEVFTNDFCKVFDFDNDRDIDEGDRCIFCCLSDDCTPDATCVLGKGGPGTCCDNLVNNGFVGVVFGGDAIGDRDLSQVATSQLPGVCFVGNQAGDRAGHSISSAGDFNLDGFDDLLITAPGRSIIDDAGRTRLGVVYLVFGGTHLIKRDQNGDPALPPNQCWGLDDVGSDELPGIKFFSPYVSGRPNEAPPTAVGFIGDINNDGFGDIAIGNDRADFIDPNFPQGPDAPGTDPTTGRKTDVGDVYIIYGNNFDSNTLPPSSP